MIKTEANKLHVEIHVEGTFEQVLTELAGINAGVLDSMISKDASLKDLEEAADAIIESLTDITKDMFLSERNKDYE